MKLTGTTEGLVRAIKVLQEFGIEIGMLATDRQTDIQISGYEKIFPSVQVQHT